MSTTTNIESLNKISSVVSERDKKIWENEAHSACIKKATKELDIKINKLKKAAVELERENYVLHQHLVNIQEGLEIQKHTVKATNKSILLHETLKENLIRKRDKMRNKYNKVLQMYEEEYNDYRVIYVNNSRQYKDLRERQILLKKLKIKQMNICMDIKTVNNSRKKYKQIQNEALRAMVVNFAMFYSTYHKSKKIRSKLLKKKNEEKEIMKRHFELVKLVKEKQEKKAQERKQKKLRSLVDPNTVVKDEEPKENNDSAADKLQKFLNEEIQTFSLTSLDSSPQQPEINSETNKVRILDMKVVKPPRQSNNASGKPDVDLRKKMESIIKTTRKSALRASSTQVTPSGSQQSQIENILKGTPTSQNSQEKSAVVNEKSQITPILKQNKDVPIQVENLSPKDDTTSKFFALKKKTVTFQNENIGKTSQEENQLREIESKFTFQAVDKSKENQSEKEDSANRFQFGINKDNIKPVELNAMDVFRKPFNFGNEIGAKHEVKQPEHFMQNLSFGMFATDSKQESSAELETPLTVSTGLGSTEKKTCNESTFDPFEASFNPNNTFVQSPLNTNQEPESSNTFNFFGSQNKNNLFNMF